MLKMWRLAPSTLPALALPRLHWVPLLLSVVPVLCCWLCPHNTGPCRLGCGGSRAPRLQPSDLLEAGPLHPSPPGEDSRPAPATGLRPARHALFAVDTRCFLWGCLFRGPSGPSGPAVLFAVGVRAVLGGPCPSLPHVGFVESPHRCAF